MLLWATGVWENVKRECALNPRLWEEMVNNGVGKGGKTNFENSPRWRFAVEAYIQTTSKWNKISFGESPRTRARKCRPERAVWLGRNGRDQDAGFSHSEESSSAYFDWVYRHSTVLWQTVACGFHSLADQLNGAHSHLDSPKSKENNFARSFLPLSIPSTKKLCFSLFLHVVCPLDISMKLAKREIHFMSSFCPYLFDIGPISQFHRCNNSKSIQNHHFQNSLQSTKHDNGTFFFRRTFLRLLSYLLAFFR